MGEGGAQMQLAQQKKPKAPLPVPMPKVQGIEKEMPPALRGRMGERNWRMFRSDMVSVLREHKATAKELGEYLRAAMPQMQRAAGLVRSRHGGKPEDVFHAISGIFASGYLHGIDPFLLLAVADTESRFKPALRSRANAMGYMQVTATSALSELSQKNRYRKGAEAKFRKNLNGFGGAEFTGLKENPAITLTRAGGPRLGKDDSQRLLTHALYNAVWACRTILLKYGGGKARTDEEGRFVWGRENADQIKDMLKRYHGGQRSAVYARHVYYVYQNSYKPLEGEEKVTLLGLKPRLTRI